MLSVMSSATEGMQTPRRVFVWPGTYDASNAGDVAMLQIAVRRLKSLWPESELTVLARKRAALEACCPGIQTVSMRSCRAWLKSNRRPGAMVLNPLHRWQSGRFASAAFGSDLLVLSGCGMLTDVFQIGESRVLRVFAAAIDRGIPAVMVGQGLGPMRSAALRREAVGVLPRLKALFLRDSTASLELARELGVPEERIAVTGDDAVELAYQAREPRAGTALGVNLRLAHYSGLTARDTQAVRAVVTRAAAGFQVALQPVAIASGRDSDIKTLRELFPNESIVAGTQSAIRAVASCGVVVAGSYHAGVFALAQGIPIVAVVNSDYYAAKFTGLAGQFGCGCSIVQASEQNFEERLAAEIQSTWERRESLRPSLLRSAQAQVSAGRVAYQQLPARISGEPLPAPGDPAERGIPGRLCTS
jgi:colanic acid/amylovoran biosynthesis protein